MDYEGRLSKPRLASYRQEVGGDLAKAVALYEWNCSVSGAFYELLADVEVILRNALHQQLTANHAGLPGHWYDDPRHLLTREALENVAVARKRVRAAHKAVTPDEVVAELNFGFWRYLLVKRYKPTLWKDALRHAFPNLPPSDTDKLFGRVVRLHGLRNRIAHHEPIHGRKLSADLMDCRITIGCICAASEQWASSRERVTQLLQTRPTP